MWNNNNTSRIDPLILRVNDRIVFDLGVTPTGHIGYVPVRVVRRSVFTFFYSFVDQSPNFLPLGPFGAPANPGLGYQSYFVDNLQLALTSISNVTNMFTLTEPGEILQLFYGLAPRYLRTYLRQPLNQPVPTMDQNIYATSGYIEPGYIDGFESPLEAPSPLTETFVTQSATPNWALANSVTVPINPLMRFFINRIVVEAISDPALIAAIFKGTSPAKWVSLGSPYASVSWSLTNYPNTRIYNRAQAEAGR